MTRPLIGIFDCSTQQETTREMNDEEYANYLLNVEMLKQNQEVFND